MTVRIYPAPWKHPLECPVCDGRQKVTVRSVVATESRAGIWRGMLRWLPTRLALVIDCPQCTGADQLAAHLPRDVGGMA